MKTHKRIPQFKSIEEESKFWDKHSPLDFPHREVTLAEIHRETSRRLKREGARKKAAKPMNDIEAKAKEIALAYERQRIMNLLGADATRRIEEVGEGDGYEIKSPDGRTIEVKGSRGHKPNYGFVINSQQEVDHLKGGGFIYRVIDVDGAPKIYVLRLEDIHIVPRFRADVRIRQGSRYEVIEWDQNSQT